MHRFPKKSINRPLILSPGGVYGWMDQCLEYIFIPNTIWPLLSRGISFFGGGWGTHIQWHVTVWDRVILTLYLIQLNQLLAHCTKSWRKEDWIITSNIPITIPIDLRPSYQHQEYNHDPRTIIQYTNDTSSSCATVSSLLV